MDILVGFALMGALGLAVLVLYADAMEAWLATLDEYDFDDDDFD